jgi:hypothetical protein
MRNPFGRRRKNKRLVWNIVRGVAFAALGAAVAKKKIPGIRRYI